MKRRINSAILLVASVLMLSVFNSCVETSKSEDAEALLKTVPEEALAVATIDTKSLMEKGGLSIENGQLKIPVGMEQEMDDDIVALLDMLVASRAEVLVAYAANDDVMLTGLVDDVASFKDVVSKHNDSFSWERNGDLESCGDIYLRDNQFWIVANDDVNLTKYTNVAAEQSAYAKNELVADLANMDKDVKYMCDVDRVQNFVAGGMDMEVRLAMQMVREMISKDFVYVKGGVTFADDAIVADMTYLNSKFEDAEFVFELDKIDASLVDRTPAGSELVVAVGTSSKMWTNLVGVATKYLESVGGGAELDLIRTMLEPISNIDGTIMVAIDGDDRRGYDMKATAFVQTNNESAARDIISLTGMLGDELPKEVVLTNEGSLVKMSYGSISEFGNDEVKSLFKGNYIAMYIDGVFLDLTENIKCVEAITFVADRPAHCELKVLMRDNGKNENSLQALIKGKF